MATEATIAAPKMTETHHKMAFFRQSGWMMIATVAGGVFMAAVHIYSKVLPPAQYAAVGTLFQLLSWITMFGVGYQMVFAQQASAAVTEVQRRQLVRTLKTVMFVTGMIVMVIALVLFIFHARVTEALKLNSSVSLVLTVLVGALTLMLTLFQGVLQGRQNFLWLGWVFIFNGVGRFFIVGLVVSLFYWRTVDGVMVGVIMGLSAALLTALWQNRDLLRESGAGAEFDWWEWLKRVAPLTLGFGSSLFLQSADVIVVQTFLGGDNGNAAPYIFGGTLARAIPLLTGPLAAVMFPKLVHSRASSQKHSFDLMTLTLIGTAVLSSVAAVGLTVTAPLLIKYGSKPEFVSIVPLIPLFAWSMVPLAVGNVLLNNLMAHSRFRVAPVVALVAASYWIALLHHHNSFKEVIQTLGVFNLILLAVCALFTWVFKGGAKEAAVAPPDAGGNS